MENGCKQLSTNWTKPPSRAFIMHASRHRRRELLIPCRVIVIVGSGASERHTTEENLLFGIAFRAQIWNVESNYTPKKAFNTKSWLVVSSATWWIVDNIHF